MSGYDTLAKKLVNEPMNLRTADANQVGLVLIQPGSISVDS